MNKSNIISKLIKDEGGFADHKHDPGGKTKYGITEKRARAWGYKGAMSKLTIITAIQIYSEQDWMYINCDELLKISPDTCEILLTIAVMSGPHTSAIILQQVMNALATYKLTMDGSIGPRTLTAMESYVRRRGDKVLVKCIKARYVMFLIGLVEKTGTRRAFIHGWVERICK